MNLRQFILGTRYHGLYQKWINRGVEIERLELINGKLLARSERFHTACISMEKQKASLSLKLKEAEDLNEYRYGDEGLHRSKKQYADEIASLKADLVACDLMITRQEEVIKKQRAEILHLIEK